VTNRKSELSQMHTVGHSVTAKDSSSNNTVSSLAWLHDSPGVPKDRNILWSEGRKFTAKMLVPYGNR